jgi:hypothetical protein
MNRAHRVAAVCAVLALVVLAAAPAARACCTPCQGYCGRGVPLSAYCCTGIPTPGNACGLTTCCVYLGICDDKAETAAGAKATAARGLMTPADPLAVPACETPAVPVAPAAG